MSKTRGFVVTDWNLNNEESYREIMEKEQIQFIAFGREVCPKSNRQHNQAFIYFYNPRSTSNTNLNKIGNIFGEKHCFVKKMMGNFKQNEAYCSKEGDYNTIGEEPEQGSRGDIKENCRLILTGKLRPNDLAVLDPSNFNMYQRTYNNIFNQYLRKQFRKVATRGVWYWGKTGVGKSHNAFRDFSPETHYVKDLNVNWWDNYEQQRVVILNEFRGQIKYGELLDLLDKWPKSVPIRNNPSIPFTSSKIIITSSKPPEEIYSGILGGKEALSQLLRRCQIIELKPKKIKQGSLDKFLEQKCTTGNIGAVEES